MSLYKTFYQNGDFKTICKLSEVMYLCPLVFARYGHATVRERAGTVKCGMRNIDAGWQYG